MTPQDIRERTLEKVLFTGYDMGAVDRLREECAEALAAKEKEVAVLSGKIKVLVTSVEEYRATEEEMRRTLRIAQERAEEITAEAEAKASKITSDAEAYARQVMADADAYSQRVVGGLQQAKAAEEERLLNAQSATVRFIEETRSMCMTQLDYLDTIAAAQRANLPEEPEIPEAPVVDAVAEEAEAVEESIPLVEVDASQLPEPEEDEEQPLDGQLVMQDAAPVELTPESSIEDTQLFHISSED